MTYLEETKIGPATNTGTVSEATMGKLRDRVEFITGFPERVHTIIKLR